MRRDWARILLTSEPATVRVYSTLRSHLCRLMGASGFHAVATRALTLARTVSPALILVHIAPDGSLPGLTEMATSSDSNPDNAAGLILIAQLLGYLTGLLGEATTLQLIADVRVHLEDGRGCVQASDPEPAVNEPLNELLAEIDRLRSVGDRLENMAGNHAGMETGLITVAENIRSIATVLDIFTVIRSNSELPPKEESAGYVM